MVKAELKEIRSVLIKVNRGKCPRESAAVRVLRKEKAIKIVRTGKRFGDIKCTLTPKGKRFLKALK